MKNEELILLRKLLNKYTDHHLEMAKDRTKENPICPLDRINLSDRANKVSFDLESQIIKNNSHKV